MDILRSDVNSCFPFPFPICHSDRFNLIRKRDDIVDSFGPPISRIDARVNTIDNEVYTIRSDDMALFLRKIESGRRSVLSLLRLLTWKKDVLRALEKHHGDRNLESESEDEGLVKDELSLYFGDVHDHVATHVIQSS